MLYRHWQSQLPDWIQVLPVELPGRGSRMREPLFRQLEPLINTLMGVVQPLLTLPYAFFGHSMGGLISFELTRALRRVGRKLPQAIFISGYRAPQLPNPTPPTYPLPEDQLIAKITAMNGIPPEILAHPELLNLIIPILRADFEVCDTYTCASESPLPCPITVFGGKDDPVVPPALLLPWCEQTTQACVIHEFSGDHFFLQQHTQPILEQIRSTLCVYP
ncbi:MAG: thioesterase [Herpetosiphonaceae bacterium]|nr:thioesterase [Herpetosiphonaceae bacterium]